MSGMAGIARNGVSLRKTRGSASANERANERGTQTSILSWRRSLRFLEDRPPDGPGWIHEMQI